MGGTAPALPSACRVAGWAGCGGVEEISHHVANEDDELRKFAVMHGKRKRTSKLSRAKCRVVCTPRPRMDANASLGLQDGEKASVFMQGFHLDGKGSSQTDHGLHKSAPAGSK